MDRTTPSFPTDALRVEAWDDPIVERLGHDPRSAYVETFWLSILGPSTVWLLRRLVSGLEAEPAGFDLDLVACAASLGLGNRAGKHGPFARSLVRACQFGAARPAGPAGIQVRRRLAPLTRSHVARLPEWLQAEHGRWLEAAARPAPVPSVEQADALAATLVRAGEGIDLVEQRLVGWGVPSVLAADAAARAWGASRHPSRLQPAQLRPV
jgi:hypothetical protein